MTYAKLVQIKTAYCKENNKMVTFDRKKIFTIIENFLEAYNNALNLPEEDLHINDNKNLISNKESHDRINLILGLAITITYVHYIFSNHILLS